MHPPPSIAVKFKNALRIDRAFLLVWKASRNWTILSILLTLIQGVIPLLTLYILKLLIDTITLAIQSGNTSDNFRQAVFLIIISAVLALFQAAVRLLGGYVAEAQSAVVTDYVSSRIHEKSIDLDLAYYENPKYHDTLHRAQREGPYRPTKIVNGLTQTLQNGVSLFTMAGLLFMFHWVVGFLLFVSTIPGLLVQIIHARKRFEWQKEQTPMERRTSYLGNVLTAEHFAKEIRLFNLGSFFSTSYDTLRALLRREKLSLSRKRSIADFLAQAFAAAILAACLVLITLRALQGAITVGDMIMYYQAFQRGIGYLKDLLANIASLYEDNMFVAHFFEFLDIQNEIVEPVVPARIPSVPSKGITLEHVSFRYPGDREAVLKDISLTIGPGEVVALIGTNGAGKSTLVKLLCRLYDPAEGRISMEDIDFRRLSLKDLRLRISVVFQDYAKYFLTVKENIGLGDIETPVNSERIREAAVKADADPFIQKLPHGYDTTLGRWFWDGEELSLGEWQKLVLARAFLRQSQFIILDEPTSSMDVNTEHHLYTKFKELITGRSALLISHRFSTVRMADRIYVIENGRIAEEGTHAELMAVRGIYCDMYTKQAAWLNELKN